MSYLAPKLKQRVQIQKPVQTPNDRGGFDLTYETIDTIWAKLGQLSNTAAKFVRMIGFQNANDGDMATHEFTIRYSAVSSLGREYGKAFDSDFDMIEDLSPLKSEYFLFMQRGSTVKGVRYQIISIQRDDDFKEFIKLGVKEIEESGTGASEGYY